MHKSCEFCGVEFSYQAHNAKYCSQTCTQRANTRRRSEEQYGALPESIECENCGEEFKPTRTNQYFCSQECLQLKPYTIDWASRTYTEQQFREAVKDSTSRAEVLRRLGLTLYGSAYEQLNKTIKALAIDTSHFTGQAYRRGAVQKPKNIEEYLVNGSTITSYSLKLKLWKAGLKDKECEKCGIREWLGEEAPLSLHHVNGQKTDNRIDNLQILCHNCHAQTSNFTGSKLAKNFCKACGLHIKSAGRTYCDCGKVWRTGKEKKDSTIAKTKTVLRGTSNSCIDCGASIGKSSRQCGSCYNKSRTTKVEWPPTSDLLTAVERLGYSGVGRWLGVSDNAVRKRIRNHPPNH